MDLTDLYQEIILDHGKRPRNKHSLDSPTHQAEGHNPMCGDQIRLQLIIHDNIITQAAFNGCGCAISSASASILTETIIGKTTDQAESLYNDFKTAVTTQEPTNTSHLGELEALLGVKKYPSRVKCATLAWHALHNAIHTDPSHQTQPVTTE